MPSFPPRYLEPHKKREIHQRRVNELRVAIRAGASAKHLVDAAEKVRSSALLVIKAKRAIIASKPASLKGGTGQQQSISLDRRLTNLERESARWLALEPNEIVARYR